MKTLTNRWVVFFVTIVVHGIATGGRARFGIDTLGYIQLADGFRAHDASAIFNLAGLRWTKTIYLALLALARGVSPAHWTLIMVVLNVVASGVVAMLLAEVARRASRSAAGPAIALLFYLASYEVFHWMPFILTDLLYCAVAFVPFYLVARRVLMDGEPRRPLLLAFSLLVAAFTRPPGIVLVPLVIFVELVLVERRVSPRVAAAIILSAAAMALFVRTAVMHDSARWPFRMIRPKIVEFSNREKTGEVVMDRRETFRPPPRTAADHVVIVIDRVVRFFQFTSSAYSRSHNLFNLAWFIPLYALGLIGIIDGLRRDDRRRRSLIIALVVWIGVFAFFHAMTQLDFDWRFRTPLIPHFILLAACGADVIAGRWSKRIMT